MKTKDQEIICNCCKKVVQREGMIPDSEFLHVEKTWGYFSQKDGEWQEFEIISIRGIGYKAVIKNDRH